MAGRVSFRRLARGDLPTLQRWLNTPHVYEWWGVTSGPDSLGGPGAGAATDAQMEEKYGAPLDHGDTTHRHIITVDERSIGLIQWYRLADEPEYAAYRRNRSWWRGHRSPHRRDRRDRSGPRCRGPGFVRLDRRVRRPRRDPRHRSAASPNTRSCRAFEKAGFVFVRDAQVPDEGPERVHVRTR